MAISPVVGTEQEVLDNTGTTTQLTVSPTADNLLTLRAVCDSIINSVTDNGTGTWSVVPSSYDGGNTDHRIFYKIAAGDETTVTLDTGNDAARTIHYQEYEGNETTSVLDASVSAASGTGTGTTGTTTQSATYAIALRSDSGVAVGNWSGWTNGFTQTADLTTTGSPGTEVAGGSADLALTSTQTVSTAATHDGGGTASGGVIAVFKAAPEVTDTDAEDAPLTVAGQDASALLDAPAAEITFSIAAQNATVLADGSVAAAEAAFSVTAQDATIASVSASPDAVQASFSVTAPFDPGTSHSVTLEAINAVEMTISALNATPSTSTGAQPSVALFGVSALDAIVQINDDVAVQAQEATISFAGGDAVPVGEANVIAEIASLSVAAGNTDKRAVAAEGSVAFEAHNGSVAVDAGIIVTAEVAPFTVTALGATVTVSGEDVEADASESGFSVSAFDATITFLTPSPPTYTFTTPSEERHHPKYARDPYLSKFTTYTQGLSVVKRDGTWITKEGIVLDDRTWVEGVDYFVGGYTYTEVPEDVALELIADGYSPTQN